MFKKTSHAAAQRRHDKDTAASVAPLRRCVSIFFCLLCFAGCKREQRQFSQPPSTFKSYDVTMSDHELATGDGGFGGLDGSLLIGA